MTYDEGGDPPDIPSRRATGAGQHHANVGAISGLVVRRSTRPCPPGWPSWSRPTSPRTARCCSAAGWNHHALWVNQWGERLAATALRRVFQRLGKRTIGRPINVHVTRHALATTIMTPDPRDLEVASAALAHRGTTSLNRVYDRSGAETADAAWKAVLRDRKRRAKSS
jgi:hypothetical protein